MGRDPAPNIVLWGKRVVLVVKTGRHTAVSSDGSPYTRSSISVCLDGYLTPDGVGWPDEEAIRRLANGE